MKNLASTTATACLFALAPAAFSQSFQDASRSWEQQVGETLSQTKTAQFDEAMRNETTRSRAAVNAAPTPTGGNYFPIINSPEVTALGTNLQAQGRKQMNGVGSAEIAKAKSQLPRFTDDRPKANNSPYNVVSDKGLEIVRIIRQMPQVDAVSQRKLLMQLQELSKLGYPEAVNFLGFTLEYGLFGVKVDRQRAMSYYLVAAGAGYQPSLFNAANFLFYGKAGKRDPSEAMRLVQRAYGVARDDSNRVCGLASFMALRAGQGQAALNFASGCNSALAKLASAGLSNKNQFHDRISMLRESIGTGADDGFAYLANVAASAPHERGNFLCKYALVDRIRFSGRYETLPRDAAACYEKNMGEKDRSLSRAKQEADVRDIINFVQVETKSLEGLRAGNHVHYSWSVPYLPFGEGEVGLYQSLILTKKQ